MKYFYIGLNSYVTSKWNLNKGKILKVIEYLFRDNT